MKGGGPQLTAAQIVTLLESLAPGSQLSHTELDDVVADSHHGRSHDHSNVLDGSPIAVSGVPNLDVAQITSGQFPLTRLPRGAVGNAIMGQGVNADPAYAAPTDARASEIFLPISEAASDGGALQLIGTSYHIGRSFADAALHYASWTWHVPPGFTGITSVQIVWTALAAVSTNMYWRFQAHWAASGEILTNHQTGTPYDVTSITGNNRLFIHGHPSPMDLSTVAIGDILSIKFTRDATNAADIIDAPVFIIGLIITLN